MSRKDMQVLEGTQLQINAIENHSSRYWQERTHKGIKNTYGTGTSNKQEVCGYCGNMHHKNSVCPAREQICKKRGHFARVCKLSSQTGRSKTCSVHAIEDNDDNAGSDSDCIPIYLAAVQKHISLQMKQL